MVFKKMKKKRSSDNIKQWHLKRKEDMICIYKNCTNNTENVKKRDLRRKEIVFYRFPSPDSNLAKFHKWMILSDIEDAQLARQWNSSICSAHFRDGRPTKDSPNPIPHDEQTKNTSEMPPKKKKHLSQRKYAGKTIVIDDEQASAPSASAATPGTGAAKSLRKANGELVETLQMQCWSEDLSPAQLEAVQRREKEYNELVTRLDTLAKQNGGEVVYKGDACMAYQFNTNPPALATFSQSNGMPTPSMPAPATVPDLPPSSVVLPSIKPPGPGTAANTYKLVMDPRLGLIVGTMTPAPAPPPPPPPVTRPRRGRPVSTPQVQYSQPPVAVSTPATSAPPVRPAESTAVGGLAAGTVWTAATVPTTPIVDLTHDDGRPPPDSREVAFNKLQGKTFPSLVVVARPHLHAKEAAIANDRSVLDAKVKSVLVHTPTKFTEWLIQQGLVRSEQHCSIHPNNKLNLGMYSDVSKFPYSGGYVWISECCPHRFVSVFSGSLFEGAAHPPTVLLKLLYHWSCQTNIQNVVQWVKVDNLYVKGLWTWLRAVCSYALQQHVQPLGGAGKRIEVGVISLGTTSQDGSQRQVKVEVLGILDPELRLIRLRAVEPLADGERNYKRRFSKILEPLRVWVHPDSIIATDLTVDKGTLHFMGFSNILQSTATGVPGNQAVMEYLRKIVPRMFQNTLSLLSRQIIQQFLDELVWREWYGQTAAQAFNNMVVHLAEQTRMNVGESLIQRLNKVAANPFKNHAAIYQQAHKLDPPSAPAIVSLGGSSSGVKRYGRKQRIDAPPPKRQHLHMESATDLVVPSEAMVPLESYYYGTLEGEGSAPLAQRVTLNVRCCVCKVPYTNNVALLDHLLAHAHNMGAVAAATQCRYCLAALPGIEELNNHIGDVHPIDTRSNSGVFRCVLCEQRYPSVYSLGKHLSREHVPQELPYQCGTCGFRTSSHRRAIDHFYTRHDGAATLQCPFCLKSTAVWSSGRIMSTNVTFFLAHLQKHQKKTMAKKCQQCALWFIQKETLKEHQQKAHSSLAGRKGVKSWALPNNYALVPKSRIYGSTSLMMEPVEVSPERPVVDDTHQLTLVLGGGPVRCVECGGQAASPGHFPRRASCDACRYVTDCAGALASHRCHGDMPPLRLSKELYCCCGYSSDDGNRMAKHLALCERKTAYPTAEQAQVATDHQAHSMLDVLGLVRKHDEPMEVDDEPVIVEPEVEAKVNPTTITVDDDNIPIIEPIITVEEEPEPESTPAPTVAPKPSSAPATAAEPIVEETETSAAAAMETEPAAASEPERALEPESEASPVAAADVLDDIIETTDNPVPKLELGDIEVAGTVVD